MADNEIINEWKDEIHRAEYIDSSYCDCIDLTLIKNTLDLINRQKEEIKRLKNRDLQVEVSDKLEREIKAEAIKEFAEKVKETSLYEFIEEYFENAELCYEARQDQFCEHIDNLVKEMVGDTE